MPVGNYNVSNCDIICIMDNLKCENLGLRNQTLESEKARALVRLDIKALA